MEGSCLEVASCLGAKGEESGDGTLCPPSIGGTRVGSMAGATAPLCVGDCYVGIFTEKIRKTTFRVKSYMQ